MPDTPQLIAEMKEMTAAFHAMEEETRHLAETHERDLSVRRTLRWIAGVAATIGVLVLVAVSALAVIAIRTANEVQQDAADDRAQACLTSVAFRADFHRGIDAVLDSLVAQLGDGGPSVAAAVAEAKLELRKEVAAEPPCLELIQQDPDEIGSGS